MPYPANSARAEASRNNGRKSKGPVTASGKARASRNALKHGLRAKTTILLEGEDKTAFETLDQGLKMDLRPEGPLETLLASRLAIAAWRMDRADRIEAELFSATGAGRTATLGEKITRDRHGPQTIDCLIRYRGTTQAEFWRALAALRGIQNQRNEECPDETRACLNPPADSAYPGIIEVQAVESDAHLEPNEPERR